MDSGQTISTVAGFGACGNVFVRGPVTIPSSTSNGEFNNKALEPPAN